MTTRRNFLKQSGIAALAGLALPRLGQAALSAYLPAQRPAGLQLYTLGDLMVKDPVNTLKQVAAIGYREVESAGSEKGNFYGYEPKEFAKIVKDQGLHWRSAHVGGAPFSPQQIMKMAKTAQDSARIKSYLERQKNRPKALNLKDNYQELAEKAAEGGLSYLVCSSIPVSTLDEIKVAVEVFTKTGEACKKVGVQFAYHNHVTEFDTVEGHRPFDYILSHTDKNQVKMELDLAWATKAGQDPVQLFREHPGRFPLWHVKDLSRDSKEPTEVGNGIIDFKRIFDQAGESGLKYFFVEQDGAPKPLEDIKISFENLKKISAV
jgi:sugar phosphate isomerase/epimerase